MPSPIERDRLGSFSAKLNRHRGLSKAGQRAASTGGGILKPMEEAVGQAAEHGDVIGRRTIFLPEDDAHVRNRGDCRRARAEGR